MKPRKKKYTPLPPVLHHLHHLLNRSLLDRLWKQIEPRHYPRSVFPPVLLRVYARALLHRAPSQEAVTERWSRHLKTSCPSTLSKNLRHHGVLKLAMTVLRIQGLATPSRPCPNCLKHPEILDSMPDTIPATYPSDCPRFNNQTKGFGVMWTLRLNPAPGESAFCFLRFLPGSWNDTYRARHVSLTPDGPLYIVDRGFYGLVLVAKWLHERVHFLMRVKRKDLRYSVMRRLSAHATRVGEVRVEMDAEVLLGSEARKSRPRVRLIRAWLPSGEDLFLVTDQRQAPVEKLIELYGKRDAVEKFHQVLKDKVGLAHLYSFQEVGMELEVVVGLFVALAAWRAGRQEKGRCVWQVMLDSLRAWRKPRALATVWKANTPRVRRKSKKKKGTTLAPAALGVT